jgi:predicted component of type VI protein secretion system
MIPSNTVNVPLAPQDQFFWTAALPDRRVFTGKATWFLGVRSSASRPDIATYVPRLVKICSAEHIVRLVKESLAGLSLTYEPSPPSAIAPRLDTLYFRVTTSGPCWTLMSKAANAGVYAPAAIAGADLDLTMVLES